MNAKETLKKYFGYDSFRAGQEEIINSILDGKDILAIMPTGAGKSLCYEIPALMLDGITMVISPLISLMQDQVTALKDLGINATYINSSLSDNEIRIILNDIKNEKYKIVYVAPERLESQVFVEFVSEIKISMVTVDEAHCISHWGQDFRPSYLKITTFVESLKKRPILSAFTATANEEVKNDMLCMLKLRNPKIVVTGFDRKNLYYSVEKLNVVGKNKFILNYLKNHSSESGVIYCATRKNVDEICEMLKTNGIKATKYHAGLTNDERKKNQEDFIFDISPIIVATNAFGMGIDKSNVRFVIHYNMPQSMENYYQEAGRAGRDGEYSECILLFSPQDIVINKFLLDKKDFSDVSIDDAELIKSRDLKRLRVMEKYCEITTCLRKFILEYFGEKVLKPCDNCKNCHNEYKKIDMTHEAKWIINCIAETKERYGVNIVLGILLGLNRARLIELGASKYKSYNKLQNSDEELLKQLVNKMIFERYIYQTEDRYAVLKIGDISKLKNEDAHVFVEIVEDNLIFNDIEGTKSKSKKTNVRNTDYLTKAGFELFESLKKLRLEIARSEGLPPYIIFSDKTLVDMCVKLPQDKSSMLNVSGVGDVKYDKYGERFINEIQKFVNEHDNAIIINYDMKDNDFKTITKKKAKEDFYITSDEASKFQYKEYMYISDIRDELNRIASEADRNMYKVKYTTMDDYLVELGIIEMNHEFDKDALDENSMKRMPTQKGFEMGAKVIKRELQNGKRYSLLMYSKEIQRLMVEHFIKN